MVWRVYNKDHECTVIKNTSESDPHIYVVTVTNKAQKKFWGSNGMVVHVLTDP